MKRIAAPLFAALFALAALAQAQDPISFTVRIENVSDAGTLNTSSGPVPVPLSPGVWLLHGDPAPLFTDGEADRGQGLEAIAEDGDPAALLAYLNGSMMAAEFGVFDTPVGADGPGPLLPGEVYEFTFEARPGDRLTFATMFVQSNDLFFAPDPAGIALFGADGEPVSGDITEALLLWDAGTEIDQEPGTGADQAPRQAGPDTGADQNGVVGPPMMGDSPDTNGPVLRVTIEQGM